MSNSKLESDLIGDYFFFFDSVDGIMVHLKRVVQKTANVEELVSYFRAIKYIKLSVKFDSF